ncbi:MAG: ArsR/SmtB family transcription factor [Sphingomonadaceae bacterium]
MTDIFRALADESRRKLLDKLVERNGQTLVELCDGLPMSRQAVSKHLTILEATNLIAVHRRGREKLHYLNPVPLAQIVRRWIGQFEDMRLLELKEGTRVRRSRHVPAPAHALHGEER